MILPEPNIVHQPCGSTVMAASYLQQRLAENRVVMVTVVRCPECHVSGRKEVGSAVSPRDRRFRLHGPRVGVDW